MGSWEDAFAGLDVSGGDTDLIGVSGLDEPPLAMDVAGDQRLIYSRDQDRDYCLLITHIIHAELAPMDAMPARAWPPALKGDVSALSRVVESFVSRIGPGVISPHHYELIMAPRGHSRLELVAPETVRQRPRSAWADAIGPVYTASAIEAVLGLSAQALDQAVASDAILSIPIEEEPRGVFPAAQVFEGSVVAGIGWVLGRLPPRLIDRASLAAWLNNSQPDLGARTVWEALRSTAEFDGLTEDLKTVVEELRTTVSS